MHPVLYNTIQYNNSNTYQPNLRRTPGREPPPPALRSSTCSAEPAAWQWHLPTMHCQKCRTPLKLDNSLEDLNPAAYDLLVGKHGCPPVSFYT